MNVVINISPRKGRWEKDPEREHYHRCSRCKKPAFTYKDWGPYEREELTRYCPECGAKLLKY